MKHVIIGTAGHVDHGKTNLIRALTGIETDRLQEEKERGISIELGFANLTLPSGRTAGIVDVPGHERFIKNMLAGVSGIDLVLLVIAADEGVMPQTREHFDILQLLQVKNGIVVLTKIDLVEQDWLELVQEEIRDFLSGTTLESAPIIPVSSVTGEGIQLLLNTIDKLLENTSEKPASGQMRLPVDRVFSVTGFGTVVTGTMVSGEVAVGEEVEIMPSNIITRVRGLQVHGQKVERARAGQRVAVNLAGVEVDQINRGNVVCSVKSLTPSYRLDTKLHLLESAEKPLKHRARVRLHIGTDEILGRVILLDREELLPGDDAYVQFQLEDTVVAAKGDRFVIRSYSPMHTIGGGIVIDSAPKRHKRFKPEIIAALATKEKGTPEELTMQYVENQKMPVAAAAIAQGVNLADIEVESALHKLLEQREVKSIDAEGKNTYIAAAAYQRWAEQITGALTEYHKQYPLREGYPKEELRSRMFSAMNNKVFQSLLQTMADDGILLINSQTIALPSFTGEPTGKDAAVIQKIEQLLKASGYQPPNWKEVLKETALNSEKSAEVLNYLLRTGKISKIADNIYFHSDTLQTAQHKIVQFIKTNSSISVAETRDLLQTSRKYALPLLEYFDRLRVTRRQDDNRVLGAKAQT